MDCPMGFREMLLPWIKAGKVDVTQDTITFRDTGAKIYLCHCSHSQHLEKYYSAEFGVLLVDQAEQFEEQWLRVLSHRVRMNEALKDKLPSEYRHLFPKIIYSFNPGGVSSSYFRRSFVKPVTPMEVWRTPDEEGGFLRQFIPAYLRDNPSLNAEEYTRTLKGLNDEQLVSALLEGNFDALVGSFYPEFDERKHIVPDHQPRPHLFKYRTFDWGVAEPFACLWWYLADGQEYNGLRFPRGALVAYREWYGCHPNKPNEGNRMRNEDMAKGILARTTKEESCANLTITDSLPFQDRGGQTIAEVFMKEGCPLTHGDTSRISGWAQLRARLRGYDAGDNLTIPMIYFTESCQYAREYLPALQRHDSDKKREDAQEHGEATHIADCIRLACTSRPWVKDAPVDKTKWLPTTIEPDRITFDQAMKRHRQQKMREGRLG